MVKLILLATVLVASAVHADNIDPLKVPAFEDGRARGLVNTRKALDAIEEALSVPTHVVGQLLHFGTHCVDANKITPGGDYFPTSNGCDVGRLTQQWKWSDSRLQVANRASLPKISSDPNAQPCLEWRQELDRLVVRVVQCKPEEHPTEQEWFLRIHSPQIDLVNRKIYFAIHSAGHQDKCLTVFHNFSSSLPASELFELRNCTGDLVHQSFAIEKDLSVQIDAIVANLNP